MKSFLALLLSISWVYGEDRTCLRGSARVDFRDGVPTSFRARGRLQTCPNPDWGCGGVRQFGRSVLMDGNQAATPYDSRSWSTLDLSCVPPALCQKVTGREDGIGCRYADYTWKRYEPMSCNASATPPYDAKMYRQRVRMYYACCNDANNCIKAEDATQTNSALNKSCTANPELGDYISDLHVCWNRGRDAWRKYFVCDEDGPALVRYRKVCMDDVYDEWSRTRALNRSNSTRDVCFHRPTCSPALKTLITSFGECACAKAKANGFTGSAIGSLMESKWNLFCPGLEISCANENKTLWLRQRRKRRKLRFVIARAVNTITDAVRAAIRRKIARYLGMEDSEEDITVTTEASGGSTRRLLQDTSDVSIDVVGSDALNDAIESAACDTDGVATALGETVTDLTCESEEQYDTVSGLNASDTTTTTTVGTTAAESGESGKAMVYSAFAVLIGLMGYLME